MLQKKARLFMSATLAGLFIVLPQVLSAHSIDEAINRGFEQYTRWFVDLIFYKIAFTEAIQVPWVLLVLAGGAIYFTFYFRLVNIKHFRTALRIVAGRYNALEKHHTVEVSETVYTADGDNPDTLRIEGHHGEVSHFQALTAALSGTVGLGNIAGVAVAISIGGPGATFWMIVSGLLGMSSKFVECTLGVRYREIDKEGKVFGGPMYYLRKGLSQKGWGKLGRMLSMAFAILCIGGSLGGGNMFQANQTFQIIQSVTGGEQSFLQGYGWAFGAGMALLVALVIIGGIRSIARVTDKLVPLMVGIYVVAALVVLFTHGSFIPDAFLQILEGAFSGTGIQGGAIGVLIQGFKRASFSNEAGIGSASIAHSAVKTRYPASEGLVSLLEPFIDTVVVCTMTALVLVISNMDGSVMQYGSEIPDGVMATSRAFASSISWFPVVLAISVFMFAFSTMISWSYYGYQAWSYLFGRSKSTGITFKILFCLCVVIGASAGWGSVIDFSDAMIFGMMVPNMVGLYMLAPEVKQELSKYLTVIRKLSNKNHAQ